MKTDRKTKTVLIDIDLIRVDGGTQSRLEINPLYVDELRDAVKAGAKLPPVVLYEDGVDRWLADGFHRLQAHRDAGRKRILAEVRNGSKRDAILYAVGANAAHGQPRTSGDKRKSVMTLLTDPEWSRWSNVKISKACNCSESYVRKLRDELPSHLCDDDAAADAGAVRLVERGGKTFTQKVKTSTIASAIRDKIRDTYIADNPMERRKFEALPPDIQVRVAELLAYNDYGISTVDEARRQVHRDDYKAAQEQKLTEEKETKKQKQERDKELDKLRKKWKTEQGQLWVVGQHKLLIDDCTVWGNIERLMGGYIGKRAAMAYLDPPYGISYHGRTKDYYTMMNDNLGAWEFYEFLRRAFHKVCAFVEMGGGVYIWHADTTSALFQTAIELSELDIEGKIYWVKNTFSASRRRYRCAHEPCFYCVKLTSEERWYGGMHQSSTWFFNKPTANRLHPCEKPWELAARAMLNSSNAGDVVLDTFAGSGSTLEAAHKTERICRGCELDPRYAAVALEKMEQLGLHPKLES